MKILSAFAQASIVALAGLLAACTTPSIVSVPSPYRAERSETQSGLTPQEKNWLASNCYEGEPRLEHEPEGRNRIVSREGYALQHSSYYRQPLWVAEGFTAAQLQGDGDRDKSSFLPDPKVPVVERSELSDYASSGYDRGHMAPAGDFNRSQAATNESFFLSNMSPQVGSGFNRAGWSYLEDKARAMVRRTGRGFILTGPMFLDPEEEDPATADGLVPLKWIKGRLAIPTHYYKIIVTMRDGAAPECVAYVLPNEKTNLKPTSDYGPYIRSVDWIEARTGINFMPELAPNEEKRLERNKGQEP